MRIVPTKVLSTVIALTPSAASASPKMETPKITARRPSVSGFRGTRGVGPRAGLSLGPRRSRRGGDGGLVPRRSRWGGVTLSAASAIPKMETPKITARRPSVSGFRGTRGVGPRAGLSLGPRRSRRGSDRGGSGGASAGASPTRLLSPSRASPSRSSPPSRGVLRRRRFDIMRYFHLRHQEISSGARCPLRMKEGKNAAADGVR